MTSPLEDYRRALEASRETGKRQKVKDSLLERAQLGARIQADFNTDENPSSFPDGATISQFFGSVPVFTSAENLSDLLEIQSVSLDDLLEGVQFVVDALVESEGIAFRGKVH